MTGDELNERVQRHQCTRCARMVHDWEDGLRGDGFPLTECNMCRHIPPPSRPKFDKKAELSAGIENLVKLGA